MRLYILRACLLLPVLVILPSPPVRAQVRVLLGDGAACGSCVQLEHEAHLSGPGVQGEPLALARLPDGRIWASFYPTANSVVEFSADGDSYRVLAAAGQGPAEVAYVSRIQTVSPDTVLLFDGGNGRLVYVSALGDPLRSVRVPGRILDSAPLANGDLVLNGVISSRELFGLPLHVLDTEGQLSRSFGAIEGGLMRPDLPYLSMRRIASDTKQRVWSVLPTSYEVVEWDGRGTPVQTWVRDAAWFEPYFERRRLRASQDYPPWIVDMQWIGGAQLALLIHVGAPDWRGHLGPPTRGPEGVEFPEADVVGATYTLIEVLDLRTGQVIISQRFDGYLTAFLDENRVAQYAESDQGEPQIDVLRVTFGQR